MSAESEARALIVASAGVLALVPEARVTAVRAPAGVSDPYVVIDRISTVPATTHDEGGAGASRLDNVQLQVTAYARTVADSLALGDAIRAALEAARGTLKATLNDQQAAYNDEPDLHGQVLFFSCWHRS